MSLYRTLRMAAVLTLARRYRAQLLRLVFAIVFATVTSWLYGDVADFLGQTAPQWGGAALIIKTGVVYGALFYCFWVLGRIWSGAEAAAPAESAPAPDPPPASGPLERVAQKSRLRSRRDEILNDARASVDPNRR